MRKFTATDILIITFVLVFIYEVINSNRLPQIIHQYGFSVNSFLNGNYLSIITSIFLHASPEHLALNIFALFFFGYAVEEKLGWKKTLLYFFLTAIAGEIFLIILSYFNLYPSSIPTIGASGGIFGLMGVAMFVSPFEFIMYPYLIPLPIFLIALIYSIYNFSSFLYFTFTHTHTDISYAAHLGGFLLGLFFGLYEERDRKSIIIAVILLIIVSLPFLFHILKILETTNYIAWVVR